MDLSPNQSLPNLVEHAAHLLPAQGPITVFIHHNTLHAYEHLPFEQAVVEAGRRFGCEPFMAESWYRRELERGRILDLDLEPTLRDCEPEGDELLADSLTRRQLQLALLRYPLHRADGMALTWHLNETGALWRFRQEVETETRLRLERDSLAYLESELKSRPLEQLTGRLPDEWGSDPYKRTPVKVAVRALWHRCREGTSHIAPTRVSDPTPVRPRDQIVKQGGVDTDSLVHPFLIRLCAAFLDQGVANAQLPQRQLGLRGDFFGLYGPGGPLLPFWARGLPKLIRSEQERNLSAAQSAEESLGAMDVQPASWPAFVEETFLALRGWPGMLEQARLRPDRLSGEAVPADLMDYLAVRLLLERCATAYAQGELNRDPRPKSKDRDTSELAIAFELFQVCQFLGLGPAWVEARSRDEISRIVAAIQSFGEVERRRNLHLAYERRLRVRALDAVSLHQPEPAPASPWFQAVFCIDEREESTRRYLEEVAPSCETFGTMGFFSVPMYFKPVHEPKPLPLCPVVVTPRHLVVEVPEPSSEAEAVRLAAARRRLGRVQQTVSAGSFSLTLGGILTSVVGAVTAAPDLFRVLFPRKSGQLERSLRDRLQVHDTQLRLRRDPDQPADENGLFHGFSPQEMSDQVTLLLENIGLTKNFSPIVLIVGHGSSSLNNPHEAAYDCGACGGGRGGPNARAFAQMCNSPEVRDLVRQRGIDIPASTTFVGAYHNTCDDVVEVYELKHMPVETVNALEPIMKVVHEARSRDALERCRRFESASYDLSPRAALIHVESRASDIAQPRPELGHATNAMAFVGRRSRTRGLFLDRRAFLMSYDPTQDDEDGSILGRQLRAVVPVGGGINLEYFFSLVDNNGYGCGSKLPHNVTGMIGVMDGFQSDLRTGLPWQMVEVHEPVRLLCVVETTLDIMGKIVEREEVVKRMAVNRWVQVALLDPHSQKITVLEPGGWKVYEPESSSIPRVALSHEWFHHQRDHLNFAEVGAARS